MRSLFLLVLAIAAIDVMCTMTDSQLKSATKLIRNVCQPKSKLTNAQIESIHKGEWADDQANLCYMECVLRMAQLLKDGKLNLDTALSQVATLPTRLVEPTKGALEKCKDSIKSNDKCVGASEFYKCFYEFNPETFFLP